MRESMFGMPVPSIFLVTSDLQVSDIKEKSTLGVADLSSTIFARDRLQLSPARIRMRDRSPVRGKRLAPASMCLIAWVEMFVEGTVRFTHHLL